MNVNSIVGSFVGLIAYADQTKGSFHAQLESYDDDDTYWSIDVPHSRENVANLHDDAIYRAHLASVFSDLPFISSFNWSHEAGSGRTISDIVLHLMILVSFDDGTNYPISVTFENGERRFHTSAATDILSGATNKAEMLEKAKTALETIMDSITIS